LVPFSLLLFALFSLLLTLQPESILDRTFIAPKEKEIILLTKKDVASEVEKTTD
jgi:uncharacterized BrkB/YihY/UPF0761 family membrane protein